MAHKFKNADRAKVKNPLPAWLDIPKESGYYWYWDNDYGELAPTMCCIDMDPVEGFIIYPEGSSREVFYNDIAENYPRFCGPIEVPHSPFLTDGLSEYSVVGVTWAYDADRKVMRHLRRHTEVDLEQDNYSGWILWLRAEKWFASYMEEEFQKMCEAYAPKQWMK